MSISNEVKNITVLLRIYSALLLHISTQKNIFLEEEVALLKE